MKSINDLLINQRDRIVEKNKTEAETVIKNIENLRLLHIGEIDDRIRMLEESTSKKQEDKIKHMFDPGDMRKSAAGDAVTIAVIGLILILFTVKNTWLMLVLFIADIAVAVAVSYFLIYRRKNNKYNKIFEMNQDMILENEKMVAEFTQRKGVLANQFNEWIYNIKQYAAMKTYNDIEEYNLEVEKYCYRVLKNSEILKPLTGYCADIFDKIIRKADNGIHLKYIEADFVYMVTNDAILFFDSKGLEKEQECFSFGKNQLRRYGDLSSPQECEGMAGAIAFLTANEIKRRYPKAQIKKDHDDNLARLHYSMININYQQTVNVI